jgi:hypothetical protein
MPSVYGVKAKAARIWGIMTTTLLYKLGKYEMKDAGRLHL